MSGWNFCLEKTSWWEIFTKKAFGTHSSKGRVPPKNWGVGKIKKIAFKVDVDIQASCWFCGGGLEPWNIRGLFYTETIFFHPFPVMSVDIMRVHSESSNPEALQGEPVGRGNKSQASSRGNPFHTIFFGIVNNQRSQKGFEHHLLLNPQMDDLVMYIQAASKV